MNDPNHDSNGDLIVRIKTDEVTDQPKSATDEQVQRWKSTIKEAGLEGSSKAELALIARIEADRKVIRDLRIYEQPIGTTLMSTERADAMEKRIAELEAELEDEQVLDD